MRGLAGKRVVVAGGATGIGAATAERLGAAGAHVLVGDLNEAGARDTAGRIVADGGRAAAGFDLTDDASVAALLRVAAAELGGLDGLFNVGAAVGLAYEEKGAGVAEVDLDLWRRTFEANTFGYVRTIRAALPLLREGGGSIVNTSSAAAVAGFPDQPAYAASKLALHALTRSVATAFGKAGVRCNAVLPGHVIGETQQARMDPALRAASLRRNRSTRLGTPGDLAAAVAFLLSDDAAWVNGQVWSVDGGMVVRG